MPSPILFRFAFADHGPQRAALIGKRTPHAGAFARDGGKRGRVAQATPAPVILSVGEESELAADKSVASSKASAALACTAAPASALF